MIEDVLIKTTAATAIDCSHIERVTAIEIDSAEPNNTETRYLLSIDGEKWRKHDGNAWVFTNEQEITAKSVLDEGNTKAELLALTEDKLAAFAGKTVDVAVAMRIGNNAELPSISRFNVIGRNSQIKRNIIYSDVFILGDESVGILNIDESKIENSGGAVEVYASAQNETGEWSDYVPLKKVSKKAKAIRFKADFEVNKPGISTAVLNNVKIQHWQSGKSAAIEGKSILVMKPITLDSKVNRAYAIIRHPNIRDTEFKVSVLFGNSNIFEDMHWLSSFDRNGEIEEDFELVTTDDNASKTATLKVEIIQNSGVVTDKLLGTGNGKQQTFKLEHHARPETLKVTGSSNWTFKEKTDTLIVTAKTGDDIYVSYDWIAKTTNLTALACIFNA